MNNQKNRESVYARSRRALPFFVEFVKFSIGFATIIAIALVALNVASASM